MSTPREFVSEPFEFERGGVLSVGTGSTPRPDYGQVEYRLEGSEDKTHWAELLVGAASPGEELEVTCHDHVAPWGRVRLRTSGPDASLSVCMVMESMAGRRGFTLRFTLRVPPPDPPSAKPGQHPRQGGSP